jgi:GH15 family glucan-1,4-alpha-glucosidase
MADGQAFGAPGIPPTWTSSAKDLVTTALGASRVWVTLGYGIVNEVYWPATGEPQIRDLGFILARDGRWIELKRANRYRVTLPAPSVPVPRIVHEGPDYRFTIEVVPDPRRDVVLISYAIEGPYDVHVLLAPHLGGSGLGNTAWVEGALLAQCETRALALVADVPFVRSSAGFVGASDGWIEMIRRAATYLARTGPMSPQDRWEENAGANPFTLAVEVAALVAAAPFLDAPDRAYALSLADYWNARIEDWCYVSDTDLARRVGVPGYYVRIASPTPVGPPGRVEVRNRAGETVPAAELVGLEFAYLARLGLRRADAPEMRASLQVADAVLRVETPSGPLYHRYNCDGYGEHDDGGPFDGTGIGRVWPLLTGEVGHLALLDHGDALPYLETMRRTAGPCGLLPEQAWDTAAVPERGLFPGRPSGSAMPLVWAHAEFLKLLMARAAGRPCERLRSVESRYDEVRPDPDTWRWRDSAPFAAAPEGKDVVIEDTRPFALHVGVDGWQDAVDLDAEPIGLGMYGVRLPAAWLAARRRVQFTRRYAGSWEGVDHEMTAEAVSNHSRPGGVL